MEDLCFEIFCFLDVNFAILSKHQNIYLYLYVFCFCVSRNYASSNGSVFRGMRLQNWCLLLVQRKRSLLSDCTCWNVCFFLFFVDQELQLTQKGRFFVFEMGVCCTIKLFVVKAFLYTKMKKLIFFVKKGMVGFCVRLEDMQYQEQHVFLQVLSIEDQFYLGSKSLILLCQMAVTIT
eukprot:TRINITY_DN1564_c0_g3_i4.p2 TRINITY_DN1564_c0_g3~~TRINITY_DN1564_c0_g3_i4.p2  ORF type:complete len:177 (+),score=8.60 TRINITY_DN1564_c0_g3_i4:841-1371(+)